MATSERQSLLVTRNDEQGGGSITARGIDISGESPGKIGVHQEQHL